MIQKSALRSETLRPRISSVLFSLSVLFALLLSACGFLPMDRAAYTTIIQDKIRAERDAETATGYSCLLNCVVADPKGDLYLGNGWREESNQKYALARWSGGKIQKLAYYDYNIYSMVLVDYDLLFGNGTDIWKFNTLSSTFELIRSYAGFVEYLYRFGDYLVVCTSDEYGHVLRLSDFQEIQTFYTSEWQSDWVYVESIGRQCKITGRNRSYRPFDAISGIIGSTVYIWADDGYSASAPFWLFPDETAVVDSAGNLFSTTSLAYKGNIGLSAIQGIEFASGKAIVLQKSYDSGGSSLGELKVIEAASPYSTLKSIEVFDHEPVALAMGGGKLFAILTGGQGLYVYEYDLDELL